MHITVAGFMRQELFFNHYRYNDSIDIRGCYTTSGAATPTYFEHTIDLGKLDPGNYRVFATGYPGNAPQCTDRFDSCKKNVIFRVYPQPNIDSISMFPPNPTEDDDITVVTHASTTRPGKKLSLGYYINMSSGDIYAKGCYAITDSFLQDEQYNDTLKLGKLRGGNYNFNFNAYLSDDTSVCGNWVDSSMMSKAFYVQPLLSAGSIAADKILSIYPNPVTHTLYIRRNAILDINSVQVKDMQGRTIIHQANNGSIDVSQLPKGLYFVHIWSDKGAVALKFMKE
jgi:hypothetical protein